MTDQSPETFILAVDHGTSGAKTALFTARGELVDHEFEPTPIRFLPGGGAEQDPAEWWRALVVTCRRLVARGLAPADRIAAVCCSSTFSSTVAVDAEGNHLGNSLTWMDSRGAPYVRERMRGLINLQGYSLGNLLRWLPRTGGGPTLSGKDDIAHILLWQHEFPEVYRKARAFLGSKDYLNLRLTGQLAASYDSVMLYWVTDTRDINHIHYDPLLVQRLGIDPDKLPPLRSSIAVLGPLLPEVAAEIGLGPKVKVIVGSPDLQSACVGSGAVRDFEGHLYLGTSSWILCHVPFKKTDPLHSIASLPSAIPGRYFCANEQDCAGECLNFLARNLLYHDPGICPGPIPKNVYALLDQAAARAPAGSRGVIFTPWLNGEKSPIDDRALRGGFHNLSVSATLDDLARAALEGVAYNSRWLLKYVERFIARPLPQLNIIGGGAQSDIWCQIYADVLDRPIRRVQHPIMANARGAAFIAAVALGLIRFEEIPELIQFDRVFQPEPGNRAVYDRLFREFLELYRRNRKIYHRLNP